MKKVQNQGISSTIRLNKYISHAGVCSRRAADTLIQTGCITVNGQKITQVGYQVQPEDRVTYRNQLLQKDKPIYLLLNKPKGYLTTAHDPQGRKTVFDLIKNAGHERVFPVGRLDYTTTGLLLFTNDGALAKKLAHPASQVKKMYHVTLATPMQHTDLAKIQAGVLLEDGLATVDQIEIVDAQRKNIGIVLHMGKNRIIRRIFEYFHYTVVKLDRVGYANLTKRKVPRGTWRRLTEKEVNYLKYLA